MAKKPIPTPVVIPAKARLHGCTPAWMQVVEPRLEQAAEVVEPRLEQAAEVVERRREQAAEESSGLFNPFPQGGNDNPASVNQPGKNTRHPDTPALPPGFRPAPE